MNLLYPMANLDPEYSLPKINKGYIGEEDIGVISAAAPAAAVSAAAAAEAAAAAQKAAVAASIEKPAAAADTITIDPRVATVSFGILVVAAVVAVVASVVL
jgi:hypothetical protein